MRKALISLLALTLMFLFAPLDSALADGGVVSDWLAAYPGACQTLKDATAISQSCVLCHTAGFGYNDYGQDIKDNSIAAVAGFDSDGDGRTNDEEILTDCTFPGDTLSVPEALDSWGSIKALFR